MLRVKSFEISDDKGINELLDNNRLAAGAHILVTDGRVCIPYEDGQPLTKPLRIVAIGEQKNTIIEQVAIIEHSQAVLSLLIADAKSRVDVAQANLDAAGAGGKYIKADVKKELERKLKEAQDAYNQLDNQRRMNEHEIVRYNINLEKHNEQIEKLQA